MYKKRLFALALLSCALSASAQEITEKPLPFRQGQGFEAQPEAVRMEAADTLALPKLTERGTISRYSMWGPFGTWNDWSLHGGLNASLSLSATVGLGSNSGSGFAQSVALMYAAELAPRLSVAVGGYYSHFNWGPSQFNDAGLTAVLGYRFNEHWEAYLFGQKSVMTPKMPLPLYYMGDFGDKIGAEVRYNVNRSFSIGVSVWHQRVPEANRLVPTRHISGADY